MSKLRQSARKRTFYEIFLNFSPDLQLKHNLSCHIKIDLDVLHRPSFSDYYNGLNKTIRPQIELVLKLSRYFKLANYLDD